MLKEKLSSYKIILASGSPRRQQFFKELNIDFEIRLKEIEEVYPDHFKAAEITSYLATLKAKAFEGELKDNEILITSDTIVWHNNQALGKPKDAKDAFEMIKSMSGTTHEVITSVGFTTKDRTQVISETTRVTFNKLSDEIIDYYIQNFHPFDKAGAYGIQDWIGHIGVAKIDGSYTNVMGLPTDQVFNYLNSL